MVFFLFVFVNPLEEFLYDPTCVEEILLSKAVTGYQRNFQLGIRNKFFTERGVRYCSGCPGRWRSHHPWRSSRKY